MHWYIPRRMGRTPTLRSMYFKCKFLRILSLLVSGSYALILAVDRKQSRHEHWYEMVLYNLTGSMPTASQMWNYSILFQYEVKHYPISSTICKNISRHNTLASPITLWSELMILIVPFQHGYKFWRCFSYSMFNMAMFSKQFLITSKL